MRTRMRQGLSLILLLGVWASVSIAVGRGLLPGPWLAAMNLWELIATGRFLDPLLTSLYRVFLGFALGFIIALAFGIGAGRSQLFDRLASSVTLVVLFSPTLVVILAGVLILGLDDKTAILLAGLIVFPGLGIYFRDVMRGVDEELLAMANAFRVSTRDRITGIYLPYLVPPMLAATRMGFAHGWKIVFLTEAFGLTGGLGFQVRISYTNFDLRALIAWLAVFVFIMLAFEQFIRVVERVAVKWQD